MVTATITNFTGVGQPTIVTASAREEELQSGKRPALQLIKGGRS